MQPETAALGDRRSPTKGDRRRRAILDAVERLLRERPIAQLSVEDIAAAAGITRPGFYFYFESKYAALSAALADVWEEMADATSNFFRQTDEPPREFAVRALSEVAALWCRHEPLLVGMVEAAASDEKAGALWDGWIARWIDRIAERIEEERADGRAVPGPPDARALASVLLAMNERAYYRDRRLGAAGPETERTVEALAEVWLAAIWGEHLSDEEER